MLQCATLNKREGAPYRVYCKKLFKDSYCLNNVKDKEWEKNIASV